MADIKSLSRKFGEKHQTVKRTSSTDWENPSGDCSNFAQVKDSEDGFVAKIDLSSFGPLYKPENVDVKLYGHDLQIFAQQDEPDSADCEGKQRRQLQRQYRMPDNVDLSTVQLKRNRGNHTVSVDAKKLEGRGSKAVSFKVFDVTKGHENQVHVKL